MKHAEFTNMRLFFENSFSLEKQSTLYFDNNTISDFFWL